MSDDIQWYQLDLQFARATAWVLMGGRTMDQVRADMRKEEAEQAVRNAINSGVELTGWCLALNGRGDLIFLRTNGYKMGYFEVHSGPGGAHLKQTVFQVKSRDSDARFMVLEEDNGTFNHTQMVEYARRWSGYEVTGSEKEYYMEGINAAKEQLGYGSTQDYNEEDSD